jgi:hypothetical protein
MLRRTARRTVFALIARLILKLNATTIILASKGYFTAQFGSTLCNSFFSHYTLAVLALMRTHGLETLARSEESITTLAGNLLD